MNETGTVVVPEEVSGEVNRAVAWAKALVIRTPEDRSQAIAAIKTVKGHCAGVIASFEASASAAHKAWKAVTEHRAKFTKPLEEVESLAKAAIIKYDNEQEAIRIKEQKRLQAEADEAARKDRERAEKAAANLKTPELREQRMEEAAQIAAPTVFVAPVAVKQEGETTRKIWRARLLSLSQLTGIPEGDVRLSFVTFNESAANKFAVATKGAVKVPGVVFEETSSLAIKFN